jgi:hypothetical protein
MTLNSHPRSPTRHVIHGAPTHDRRGHAVPTPAVDTYRRSVSRRCRLFGLRVAVVAVGDVELVCATVRTHFYLLHLPTPRHTTMMYHHNYRSDLDLLLPGRAMGNGMLGPTHSPLCCPG